MKTIKTAVAMMVVTATVAMASWFPEGDPLGQAHAAYLKKDWRTMALAVRAVLSDRRNDEAAKQNALALVEKAYEHAGEDGIPVDWKLPSEIARMKVTLRRAQFVSEEVSYALKVGGHYPAAGTIKQLRVVRFPDTVVLDKEAKIGEWTEQYEAGDGFYYELDGPHTDEPAADGLYTIHIELANGKRADGWFLLTNLVSSDSPVVRVPTPSQTFSTRTPTMRWDDFKSPEHKSYEHRSQWIAVVRAGTSDWKEEWSLFEGPPTKTEVTVDTKLADGKYRFYVGYKEQRRFGDLRLARQSISVVPFHVKGN